MKAIWILCFSLSAFAQTKVSVPTLSKEIIWNQTDCQLVKSPVGAVVDIYLGEHEKNNPHRMEIRIPGKVVSEALAEMKSLNVLSLEKEYVSNHKREGNVSLFLDLPTATGAKTYSLPNELGDASCRIGLKFSSSQQLSVIAKCQKIPLALYPQSAERIDFEISSETPIRCALD